MRDFTMHRRSLYWYLLLLISFMAICFVLGKDTEAADDEDEYDDDSNYEHTGRELCIVVHCYCLRTY